MSWDDVTPLWLEISSEPEKINYRYQQQMAAEGGAGSRDTECGRSSSARLFSPDSHLQALLPSRAGAAQPQ